MSKGNTYEDDILKLLLNATPIANIADNAAASPLTNLWVALHTADPGEAGNQTTNEIAYTSYGRVAVARSNGSPAWTISGGVANPNATISFPAATGGASPIATHISIGSSQNGTGKVFYKGTVTNPITCAPGTTPQLTTAGTITED